MLGNDPAEVADVFSNLLGQKAAGVFETVTFAVLDRHPQQPTLRAFTRLVE